LPDGPDAKQREQIDKIGKFDGNAFDAAFKKQMVADHRNTVAAFEKAARSTHDAELKSWVQKTLPILLDHLKMAQALPG
jgi:putative membrane protein